VTQGRNGATVAELRLHRNISGERGQGELEGLGANRGVFQVVGDKAELTGATDAAGSSTATVERAADVGGQWRGTGRARRARERARGSAKGASERGEVGEQGAGLKRGAGAGTWPENVRTWARPRWSIVGERLGAADRWGRRGREGSEHVGERNGADRPGPRSARERDGERGRAGVGADRRGPPVRHRGRAGTGARAGGWAGLG
jgi:hypothetical protein